MRPFVLSLALLGALGCGDDESGSVSGTPGSTGAGGGEPASGCVPGELTLADGSCQPAGVPPEACATGFEPDAARGCTPVLPPEPCPWGSMAVPGETTCRTVAPCAEGTWGDIPIEPTTQHVDGSYAGDDSDGSAVRPWSTIQQAIDAADAGAIVAVAAGIYVGEVAVQGKSVRLWGRCPELVEIVGTSEAQTALFVLDGAEGTEVHDLAVTGDSVGLAVSGSQDVLVDRVWIHDTTHIGLVVQNVVGPTRATLHRSLVEASAQAGVLVFGAELVVRASMIRGADAAGGRGISVQTGESGGSMLHVEGSVIERNHEAGITVQGSEVLLEGSVVRLTASDVATGEHGLAIVTVPPSPGVARSRIELTGSVLADNREHAIRIEAGDLICSNTVIRDTRPSDAGVHGWGISLVLSSAEEISTGQIRASVIERTIQHALMAEGSETTVEGLLVRDVFRGDTAYGAAGIAAMANSEIPVPASLVVRGSVVEAAMAIGVIANSSTLVVEDTAIRDTQATTEHAFPDMGALWGHGLHVQSLVPSLVARATVRRSLIERSHGFGMAVYQAEAEVDHTSFLDTAANDGQSGYGDGVAVAGAAASLTLTDVLVQGNARAGVVTHGAAVALTRVVLECNTIDIDAEPYKGASAALDDRGGNVCGCAGEQRPCKVSSAGLTPPGGLGE